MNLFNVSRISIFALVLFSVLAYQNCSRTTYENVDPALNKSAAAATHGCAGGTVSCQSSDGVGYGTQTCDNAASGPIYGRCILTSCSQGYVIASGVCVPSNQPYLSIKAYGPDLPAEGVAEFSAVPGKSYQIVISGSSDVINSGIRGSDLKKLTGSCAGVESYSPWTLNGEGLEFGHNQWNYSASDVSSLGGCQWNGCVTAGNGVRGCLVMKTMAQSSSGTTTTRPPTNTPGPTVTTQPSYQSPLSCEMGAETFIPFVALQSPKVSSSCANGIEVNNLVARVYEMDVAVAGAFERSGWIDYATYDVSDSIGIYSVNASGQRTTLFSKCNISTWTMGFMGLVRPPEATLRQQAVTLPAGAVKLVFDFSKTRSPFYIRMQGLCDYQRSNLRSVLAPVDVGYPGVARTFPENVTVVDVKGMLDGKPKEK